MYKRLVHRLSQTAYVRSALEEQANLDCFKEKPTRRIIWGLVIMGISYTIGWPAVGLLGILAAYWGRPWLIAVGGPLVYGLSHLVFILGAWLAGADHAKAVLRWITRVTFLRLTQNRIISKN
ncbi:MAG: hypothetical protein PVJ84_15050 [Desulfobacteraceae bacterium]|jgi:hypothetical protein